MKPECSNCRHAMDRDHVTVWCRRYPPAMAFVQVGKASMIALPGGASQATINGEWINTFPAMQKTGLCGEHGFTPAEIEKQMRELYNGNTAAPEPPKAHFPTLSEQEIAQLEKDGWAKAKDRP